jgi:hypothetical protein
MLVINFKFPCGRTRRQFLWQAGNGFFGTAMAGMLATDGFIPANASAASVVDSPLAVRPPHHAPRAKSCIFLYMVGGPSHIDTFDRKPELIRRHGEKYTFEGASTATSQKISGQLKGAPFKFRRHGQAGIEVSELFPRIAGRIDDIAVIRSMKADSAAHGAASLQMNTGHLRQGFPSMGSWAVYGLGTLNQNMPGFVVLIAGMPYSGALNWGAGFMPAGYQGTAFNTAGDPILNLSPATGISSDQQLQQIRLIDRFNEMWRAAEPDNSELAARISNYELAFRMQSHSPEAVDLSRETQATRDLYGIDQEPTDRFGRSCLLARRLVERGVRFVEVFHSNWDTHGQNDERHRRLCAETDHPLAGLLADLKQRGLLEETIVVWAGEFGRTPLGTDGRDHHADGFTAWLAGGGIRGGICHGGTDELGFYVTHDAVHVHDLHATVLHLLGLDHELLTYFYAGRDYRLTDVAGHVVEKILA